MENKEVIFAKWLNGEISDEELTAAEGAEALAELKRMVKTMDQWSMPKYNTTAGYEKFKSVQPSKSEKPSKPAKVRKLNWFLVSGIAASFLLLILFWNIFMPNQNQVLYAENGQIENSTLEDGSQIWLYDGSTVTYTSKNWTDDRTIELTGEALFNVAKGSPFTVKTQNGSIQVLGTQFNVRAWGENLYVECYEGKVQVSVNNQNTILTASESVNVVQGSMNNKQKIINLSPTWQNASSRFYNEMLSEVFEELERQYNIKVEMKVTDRSFSGNFQHNDLEGALRNICKPYNINFEINKTQNIVVIE